MKKQATVQERCHEKIDDETLLMRYTQRGDRQALHTLFLRHSRKLYGYLCRYIGDAASAEDVLQSTFLKILSTGDKFDSRRRFRPWLYAVATNQAIDRKRKEYVRRAVSLDASFGREPGSERSDTMAYLIRSRQPDPTDAAQSKEQRQRMRHAVAQLPENLRSAVQLVYFDGLKYREAADALDIPEGTVKSRVHQALSKLNRTFPATRAV